MVHFNQTSMVYVFFHGENAIVYNKASVCVYVCVYIYMCEREGEK